MSTKLKFIILFLFTVNHSGFTQTLDGSGLQAGTQETINDQINSGASQNASQYSTGIPCQSNTFWGMNANGQVEEFSLNGSVATSNGIIVSAPFPAFLSAALAYANDIDGGTFSPTFYSAQSGAVGYKYDGTAWVQLPGSSSCAKYNASGCDTNVYYHFNGTTPWCIEKYTGGGFTNIYTDSVNVVSVADIATDQTGNIWFLTGTVQPTMTADKVTVISPSGNILSTFLFPSPIPTANAYGCFLLNGILYLGMGNSNPTYPNSLLPITCIAGLATTGTAIPITGLFSDLASCNPGSPLSTIQSADYITFGIYPVPAHDWVTIYSSSLSQEAEIMISDAAGRQVYRNTMAPSLNPTLKVNTSGFAPGMYFVRCITKLNTISRNMLIY